MRHLKFIATVLLLALAGTKPAWAEQSLFDDLSINLGAFAFVAPLYEGSDEYRVSAIPFAFPSFGNDTDERNRVSFRGPDDVRLSVLRRGGFDIGPVVGYSFGRKESVSPKLGGLGDVEGGVNVGAFTSFTANGFFVEAAFSSQVTGGGDNGFIAEMGAGYEMAVSDRLTTTVNVGGEYASGNYMNRYFSITSAQSLASTESYAAFNADAGFKNVSIGASLDFKATDKLSLRGSAGYSRLVGDAADSPISVSDDQYRGSLGFIYKF